MDEVWNRKYERGPIRIDSILSIYARMAPQERAVHIGWIDAVSDRTSKLANGNAWTNEQSVSQKAPQQKPLQPSEDSTKRY